MDAKIYLISIVAVLAGAVTGGFATAKFMPEADSAQTGSTGTEALDDALKRAAEANAKATHWESEADRLVRQLAAIGKESQTDISVPVDGVADIAQGESSPMDASMREELEEYRARNREREDRSAERREQMADWRIEMVDRRTNMFTELIDRADDPAEQQRWADIEQQMTFARELYQQIRNAETDEERTAVREALGENDQTMQSLLKEQQNAVLKRALEAEGIKDTEQQSLVQKAVQASMSDRAFQLSGRGGRGWGSGGSGRGGGGRRDR